MAHVSVKEGTLQGRHAIEFVASIAQLDAVLESAQTNVYSAIDHPTDSSEQGRAHKAHRRDAYEQARLLLASSEDHLRTVLGIIESNRLPIFSLFSLLRPAAEADVRIAYLVDATIDETARLARGLSIRLEGLREQNKVNPQPALLASRIATLEAKAIANGIHVRLDKRGLPIFGEPFAHDEVRRFKTYLKEGEFLWRFLSAHIHSRPWAMLDSTKATATSDPDVAQMPLEFKSEVYVSIIALVLGLHEQNLIRLLDLAGYPAMVLRSTKDSAMDRARAKYTKLLNIGPALAS